MRARATPRMATSGQFTIGVNGAGAEAAQIRDRHRPALHVVQRQLPGARFLRGLRDLVGELTDVLLIHVANHRHEQAAIGVDGDADVDVLLVDDFFGAADRPTSSSAGISSARRPASSSGTP